MALALGLAIYSTPANAQASVLAQASTLATPLCGSGSAPDYGFTYDRLQEHWTVGWQDYASEQAVTQVDVVLDRLNGDVIAQTMILILPQEQVGNRVNCAVHFLRYMQLGRPDGARKDNGFVFLIVVERSTIDVHYGVGLGLPALTAPELTTLNRAAEEAYQSTHSMDEALLTLVREFDTVARANYPPLGASTAAPQTFPTSSAPEGYVQPLLPAGPLGVLAFCGLLCLSIPVILFLIWLFIQLARLGIVFYPAGYGSSRGGFPFGGSGGRSGGGFPRRGGSGSGRSGRGN